jgi:uncharacterized protein (DUF1501 family)
MNGSNDIPRPRFGRREFLAGSAAAGFSLFGGAAHAFTRRSDTDDDGPILVVLQLTGGNDGLNTIVPYGDDLYHGARTALRVPASKVLPIDEYRGFHPLLSGLRRRFDEGQVAVVEGVGYPHPNRSHFASFDIWHAASERGRLVGDGWLARLANAMKQGDKNDINLAVHVGARLPYSLFSPTGSAACFDDPSLYRWAKNEAPITEAAEDETMADSTEARLENMRRVRSTFLRARDSSAAIRDAAERYRPRVEYPETRLGLDFSIAAALIQQRIGARILSVELDGFDTHAKQELRHEYLLATWNDALTAFLDDLHGTPAADRVVVLAFSEFGRRVTENASAGTDHGTAGPMFLVGPRVKGGIYGKHASLADLDDGDLKFTTDFRSVYATAIEGWLGVDSKTVLGGVHEPLPLVG